jgi:predicted metal-dependent peptidase
MATMTRTRNRSRDLLTADLSDEHALLLQAWRADALDLMPYFRRILFSLRAVDVSGSATLDTFAVDNFHRLYVNFEKMAPRGSRFCAEALLHECGHLFQRHDLFSNEVGARTKQQLMTANSAGDAAINDDLRDAGCKHVADFGLLPYQIGEEDYQTPHHYFRVLQALQGNTPDVIAPVRERTIRVTPNEVGMGTTKAAKFSASASPAFANPIKTMDVTDGAGNPVPLMTVTSNGRHARAFTVAVELDPGAYIVTMSDGTEEAAGTFTVAPPSIELSPETISRGWVAPYRLGVEGTYTHFDATTTVTVTDRDGNTLPSGNVEVVDAASLYFDLTTVLPNDVYVVTVSTPNGLGVSGGNEDAAVALPIGLPKMEVNPESLPEGFVAPFTMTLGVRDFDFTAATTFTLTQVTPFGLIPVSISTNFAVRNVNGANLTLGDTLAKGSYVIIATENGENAFGSFSVGGEGGEGSGDGEGEGNENGEGGGSGENGEGGGEPTYKGCGSGAGGEKWDGELDEKDDLGGKAAAATAPEKESILIGTAADIKEYEAKGRGTMPAGLVEIANTILAPSKTPWQRVLAAHVRRGASRVLGQREADFNRVHRRRHSAVVMTPNGPKRVTYPGFVDRIPKIDFIRDTSGSMSKYDIAAVGREVEGVARRLGIRGKNLMVIDVDAEVHEPVPYDGHASIRFVKGRGGTDMTLGIDYAVERGEADVIVVCTDGGTPWPTEDPGIPIVAAIVPQGDRQPDEFYLAGLPKFIRGVVVDPGKK